MDTKQGEGKKATLIPKTPLGLGTSPFPWEPQTPGFGNAPLQKYKNSISKALCLKYLKLRFFKNKSSAKDSVNRY